MTPFFTLLAYLKLNDPLFLLFSSPEWPPFLSFPLPNCPPFSSKSYYPMAHLFSLWHLLQLPRNFSFRWLSVFLAVLPACPQWPPFYNWLPNDPQFSGFFTPMTLLLLHLVRNGLVFTRVVYWMTPYFGEYTFYLIGPYFWLGVGTYLSLLIGSTPPPGQKTFFGFQCFGYHVYR